MLNYNPPTSIRHFKTIVGSVDEIEDFDNQITALLNKGYNLHGDTFPTRYAIVQVLVKEEFTITNSQPLSFDTIICSNQEGSVS